MKTISSVDWRMSGAFLCLCACTSPAVSSGKTALTPPACTSVVSFGNGQTCSATDPTLSSCGSKESRLCADGWLCYDGPELLDCTCTTDSDCAGKRSYVSTARAANNKSPIAVGCHGGRCTEGP